MATPTSHVSPPSTEASVQARWRKTIANGQRESCSKVSSSLVTLMGASTYIFLSNENDIVREIR